MANALQDARRRERLTQAEWRQQRAEVARLIAAGEEAAARALLEQAGVPATAIKQAASTPIPAAANRPEQREASPEAVHGPPAVVAKPEPVSGGGGTSKKKPRQTKQRRPSTDKPTQINHPEKPQAKPKPPKPLAKPLRPPTRTKRRERKTWALWLRERPPWVMSLATHGVLIAMFGLLTFGTFGEPGFSLTAAIAEPDAWDEMPAEVTLANLEVDADLSESLDAPADLSAEVELAALVEPTHLEPLTDFGDFSSLSAESLMAAVPASSPAGQGKAKSQAGGGSPRSGGAPSKVSFFGSESHAERVVFVVDNSGSMQRGRMETTLLELERAVNGLSSKQEFYVVFFSDQVYPMFFPEPAEAAVPATRPNKQRLSAWLRSVEICLGGRLLDAMELAAGLEPDLVYLLSDGDIRSSRIIGGLTAKDRWPFAINTLGMGARTQQHVALLNAIAANTGGVFRPVAAHPAAIARARLRPIPYHRQPGKVWGSAVQAWD